MKGMEIAVDGRYTMHVPDVPDFNASIMKRSVTLFVLACVCVAISCAAQTVTKDAPESGAYPAVDAPLTPVVRHPQLDRSYWGVAHVFHRSAARRRNRGCDRDQRQEHPCSVADKAAGGPSMPAANHAASAGAHATSAL